MQLSRFSKKQLRVLGWWLPRSPDCRRDAILCDGAVRSGKTLCLSLSFVMWATHCFSGMNFALCGKTVLSLRRNLLEPLLPVLQGMGYRCRFTAGQRQLTVALGGRENRFYLFGGRDEGSSSLIQGVTLAGVLLDEAALMPRSFVEQALARCSVAGSRYWFCCNPEHPFHWFYREWIEKAEEKNCLYLHFTMEDNLSLSEQIRARYRAMYTGIFYRRYILGQWCLAEGLVYEFDPERHVTHDLPECGEWYISCDYGTLNPFSAGLWCVRDGVAVRVAEFYHSGREQQRQLTDEEYYRAIEQLAGDRDIRHIVVDPSAASFIACIRSHKRFSVRKAKNDVMYGIRLTAMMLQAGVIKIGSGCKDAIREFGLYRWDDKGEVDKPVKENDHAMDDIRYFCATVMRRNHQARKIIGGICDEETDS